MLDQTRRPMLWCVAAGLSHGLLMALSFAPFGVWPLALVAPLPLVLAADRVGRGASKPWRCGVAAALGVSPWWAWATHWTASVSALGFVPLFLYLSVYAGVFVWAGSRLVRARPGLPAVAWAPVLWVGVEWLRGAVVFDGFPWYFAGHPLIDGPAGLLTWPALVFGAVGVGVLAAVPSGAIADVAGGRRRASIAGLAVVVVWVGVGVLAHFGWAEDARPGEGVRVAVVQTDVPQSVRQGWAPRDRVLDWLEMREAMFAAAEREPALLVFPEGMFPGGELEPAVVRAQRGVEAGWDLRGPDGESPEGLPPVLGWTAVHDAWMDDAARLGIPMLVGGPGRDAPVLEEGPEGGVRLEAERTYNSVFLIEGGGVVRRYDKMFLTPFGETMPYISAWPWLEDRLMGFAARGMRFIWSTGEREVVFDVDGVGGVVSPICFEATISGVCRRLVYEDGVRAAGVMVNMTNDGWFGVFDAGRLHHMQLARWRSVELGTPMVRAANTGVSAIVDRWGRVTAGAGVDGTGGAREAGLVVGEVTPATGRTAYAVVGDAAGWVCLVGLGVGVGLGLGAGLKRNSGGPRADVDREATA